MNRIEQSKNKTKLKEKKQRCQYCNKNFELWSFQILLHTSTVVHGIQVVLEHLKQPKTNVCSSFSKLGCLFLNNFTKRNIYCENLIELVFITSNWRPFIYEMKGIWFYRCMFSICFCNSPLTSFKKTFANSILDELTDTVEKFKLELLFTVYKRES